MTSTPLQMTGALACHSGWMPFFIIVAPVAPEARTVEQRARGAARGADIPNTELERLLAMVVAIPNEGRCARVRLGRWLGWW